jgi:hypothetical protein
LRLRQLQSSSRADNTKDKSIMTYMQDTRAQRVNDCGCAGHCGCKTSQRIKRTLDAENISGVPGCEPRADELANVPGNRLAPQNMTAPGAQPAFTSFKSSNPDEAETEEDYCEQDECVEKEKSVADKLRQQRDGKDPHVCGFLKAFYSARANERAKRQA